ncbi:MAG: TetR/AcrR family transcriptional regulator [Pseudoramibacter sp.]
MNKKGNTHFKQTDERIVACVLNLLDHKALRRITVAEICRTLNLNRSTFYAHFLDVDDVIEKTASAYYEEILDILGHDVPKWSREKALALLGFIQKHQAFYSRYFRLGRQLHIPDALIAAGLKSREEKTQTAPPKDVSAAASYYIGMMQASYNAVIREWLARDCRETPAWVCDMMLKCADSFGDLEGTP